MLTCFTFPYLAYVCAQTWVCAAVNVWLLNDSLPKVVPSFHHVGLGESNSDCQAWWRPPLPTQASCPPSVTLSHTYMSPLSFVGICIFLKWCLKVSKRINFYKQNHSGKKSTRTKNKDSKEREKLNNFWTLPNTFNPLNDCINIWVCFVYVFFLFIIEQGILYKVVLLNRK